MLQGVKEAGYATTRAYADLYMHACIFAHQHSTQLIRHIFLHAPHITYLATHITYLAYTHRVVVHEGITFVRKMLVEQVKGALLLRRRRVRQEPLQPHLYRTCPVVE